MVYTVECIWDPGVRERRSRTAQRTSPTATEPILPDVPFESCPIRASFRSLGRKWALLVLRDVAFLRDVSVGQILQRNEGLTARALSIRWQDLRSEGPIDRITDPRDARRVHYVLTRKGEDAVPILAAFLQYGF